VMAPERTSFVSLLLLAAQHVQQVVFTHRLGQRQASVLAPERTSFASYSKIYKTAQQFATGLGLRASCQHAAENSKI
jgi:hypothetical protein